MNRKRNYLYRIRWNDGGCSVWMDWYNETVLYGIRQRDYYIKTVEFKTQPDGQQVSKFYDRYKNYNRR